MASTGVFTLPSERRAVGLYGDCSGANCFGRMKAAQALSHLSVWSWQCRYARHHLYLYLNRCRWR